MILGASHGLSSAKPWSQSQKETADVIVNADKASNTLMKFKFQEGIPPTEARQLVRVLRTNRLNVFATNEGYYSQIGLLPEMTMVRVRVVRPADGARIKGTSDLVSLRLTQVG